MFGQPKKFGVPLSPAEHRDNALKWFAKANAAKTRKEWQKAFSEGQKHAWGANEGNLSGAHKKALELQERGALKHGNNLAS